MLNTHSTTPHGSTRIAESTTFCCGRCSAPVALVELVGGETAYECSSPTCGKTVPFDQPEGLLVVEPLPPIAALQETAAELATTAQRAGGRRAANALNKAAWHLSKGVEVTRANGDLLIPSATTAGQVYRVSTTHGCSCQAAGNGRDCWHAALAEVVSVTQERLTLTLPTPRTLGQRIAAQRAQLAA